MKRMLRLAPFLVLAAFTPAGLGAQQSATTKADRVNVRAAAVIDASIVGTLAKGTSVTVLEHGATWSKVSAGSVNGWVRTSTLVFGGMKASGQPGPSGAPTATTPPQPNESTQEPMREPIAPHAGFGAQAVWGDDSDLGIGVRVELNLLGKVAKDGILENAFAIGEFNYFFPDCGADVSCSWWEINPGLAVPIPAANVDVYAGAGLNIAHASADIFGVDASDTDIGLNIFGGLRFPLASRTGFGEARISSSGSSQFAVTFGILFGSK